MNLIKKSLTLILVLTVLAACKDFEELEKNPNRPTEVPASLLLNGALNDLFEDSWTDAQRQNQYWCCNYNYYGTNEYWASATLSYMTLKNVQKMEDEALRVGAPEVNSYSAIGKYLRAVFFVRMSQRVGDVPLSEALQGLENPAPAYDSQKDVYVQVLNWLDEANNELASLIAASDNSLAGDIYFNNDLKKWQKAVNTLKIRVLISLSKKNSDSSLGVAQKFAETLANPSKYPLMAGLEDNMEYRFNGTSNLYNTNPGSRGFDKGRYNMAETLIKGLTDLKDPRVYLFANPAEKKIAGGIDPKDFAAYIGAPSGESLDDMTFKAGNGEYSFANQKRYYTTFTGPEPTIQLGYPELCFNIAEGLNRGWATGSAEEWYNKGIVSSMRFFGLEDGTTVEITEPDADEVLATATISVTNYMAQPSVKYAGNNNDGLKQIITQKYLAFFQNSGQEAYFNYRRTGFPVFDEGPGTGNGGHIPRRWLYPLSEATNNTTNYNDALTRQFGSTVDDLDSELWLNQ
ncbi:SusD/RagB family nutrient-binding outer membrane lipoprotein [Chryseolinea sp. T2]|uniref:SusD/RagB family nutrient-binding outer membrane lipoprotein n=1 Tax=Chryseolinea sp. T2 TaxID=3129255 RepID=UPI00307823F6